MMIHVSTDTYMAGFLV